MTMTLRGRKNIDSNDPLNLFGKFTPYGVNPKVSKEQVIISINGIV